MYDTLDDEFTDIVRVDAVFSGRMLSVRSTGGDKKKNVVRTYVPLQALVKPCNEKTTYQTSGKLAFVQSMMRIYANEEYLHLSVVRRYDKIFLRLRRRLHSKMFLSIEVLRLLGV